MQVALEISSASVTSEISSRQNSNKTERQAAEQFSFGPVCDIHTACAAYRLVYSEYLKSGYQEPCPTQMRFTVLQLLPVSKTFVAFFGSEVVGTGTVVLASPAGLPSSHVFGDIYNDLAQAGRTVCEATLLACIDAGETPGHVTALRLVSWGVSWAVASGADDWCVVVNPKHLRFYNESLGMEVLGESRSCEHVNDNPGLLLRMPLRELRSGAITPTPLLNAAVLSNLPTLRSNLRHFSVDEVAMLLSRRPDILQSATQPQRELLREKFPELFAETTEEDAEIKLAA